MVDCRVYRDTRSASFGLWGKTIATWHTGQEVIASGAKQSLPANRDC
jgi:hypothetical protein